MFGWCIRGVGLGSRISDLNVLTDILKIGLYRVTHSDLEFTWPDFAIICKCYFQWV